MSVSPLSNFVWMEKRGGEWINLPRKKKKVNDQQKKKEEKKRGGNFPKFFFFFDKNSALNG